MLRSMGAGMSRGPHPLGHHLAAAWAETAGDPARMARVLDGVRRYQAHPFRRPETSVPVVWTAGTTRLLDYGTAAGGQSVLIIPSLINPFWVLDLTAEASLVRWLARQGLRPLLVDWGQPGEAERQFSFDDYVVQRLVPMLAAVAAQPVHVLGYCLGGTLAAALAALQAPQIGRLALLATPWDFAGWPQAQRAGLADLWAQHEPMARASGGLAMEILQLMFAALDPGLMARKFEQFASSPEGSTAADTFVALEDWANGGAALAYPAAQQFFGAWLTTGGPEAGWRIAGQPIDLARLTMPTLGVLSAPDRIVPLGVTQPLTDQLPHPHTLIVNAGHVGMVVGSKARHLLWEPLAQFFIPPQGGR